MQDYGTKSKVQTVLKAEDKWISKRNVCNTI